MGVAVLVLIPTLLGDAMLRRLRLDRLGVETSSTAAPANRGVGRGSSRAARAARATSLRPVRLATARLPEVGFPGLEAAPGPAAPGELRRLAAFAGPDAATDASGPGLTFLNLPGRPLVGDGGGVLTPQPPAPGPGDPPAPDPATPDPLDPAPPTPTDPRPQPPVRPEETPPLIQPPVIIEPPGTPPPGPPTGGGDPLTPFVPGPFTPPQTPTDRGLDPIRPLLPDPPPEERRPGPSPAPEPAVWASMILGFGLVGALVRRRRGRMASSRSPT